MSMTANQNHDNASSSGKRIKSTCDNDNMRPSSDLNHDVLSLVMMQLGFVDFFAFYGVCKSMRSVALANREKFMASKPPMLMHISRTTLIYNDKECCLENCEGRKFKTILPNSVCSTLVGSTCGYLIFFRWLTTCDFLLANPITKHEFHFPRVPFVVLGRPKINAVLVFSPSISRYIFVMLDRNSHCIWYSIEGDGAWNHVYSTFRITSLHVFKKKIYTICSGANSWELVRHLRELTLNPNPELRLVETKNFMNKGLYSSLLLVSWGESLYYVESLLLGNSLNVHKLDFGKMEWEQVEDTRDEHEPAFFLSNLNYGAAVKPESWADSGTQHIHQRFVRHGMFFTANQWYFPHECLNVNILDES
ncbi:unnamed protein product [Lactuca virosa]|uniref:KIB1-4 beta-propeller domain-containing protein n=1 Tax=Lactuca virosa TaxID=75947 RepID=A0AAU9N917_9ASTR|nr:unnamed protein product [Lactuca virosa]